jgi:hypothetical protein
MAQTVAHTLQSDRCYEIPAQHRYAKGRPGAPLFQAVYAHLLEQQFTNGMLAAHTEARKNKLDSQRAAAALGKSLLEAMRPAILDEPIYSVLEKTLALLLSNVGKFRVPSGGAFTCFVENQFPQIEAIVEDCGYNGEHQEWYQPTVGLGEIISLLSKLSVGRRAASNKMEDKSSAMQTKLLEERIAALTHAVNSRLEAVENSAVRPASTPAPENRLGVGQPHTHTHARAVEYGGMQTGMGVRGYDHTYFNPMAVGYDQGYAPPPAVSQPVVQARNYNNVYRSEFHSPPQVEIEPVPPVVDLTVPCPPSNVLQSFANV